MELFLSLIVTDSAGDKDAEVDADDGAEKSDDAVIFVDDIDYELGQEAGAEDSDEREDPAFVDSAHHGGFGFGVAEDVFLAVHLGGGLAEIAIACVGLEILPSAIGEHLKIFGA